MKVIELTAPHLDAFRPAIHPDPVPAYGEVLVRLRGATLNFLDLAVATGKFSLELPNHPCSSEVIALGQGVRHQIVPVVHRTFCMEEASAAYQASGQFGKITISVP